MIQRRTFLTALTATCAIAATGTSIASAADLHAPYDALLQKYVTPAKDNVNRVNYEKWHATNADRAALDSYIKSLEAQKPSSLERNEQFAYWANLYNALTVKVILDAYPVKSIRDIKGSNWFDPKAYLGPWRTERISVEGKKLSLDNIEHDIMRPTFKDPRVHYSVNCASIGCPNLQPKAWKAATLDADLTSAAAEYINTPRAAAVSPDGSLRISSIYRWFGEDFGGTDASILAHIKKYAKPELAAKLASVTKLGEDHYDWALNKPDVATN